MIQPVKDRTSIDSGIAWDMLRIDQLHPVVSGNKWFKLAPYLEMARQGGYQGLLSFGGAWSNHLHALAYAAREAGLASVGIVRGEEPQSLSPTLADAGHWGMKLVFIPRNKFAALSGLMGIGSDEKDSLLPGLPSCETSLSTYLDMDAGDVRNFLVVPTGGYGIPGMKGAAGILEYIPPGAYTHILCAVGTGTMYAGLLHTQRSISPSQIPPRVIGIPVLKNEGTLEADIRRLLPPELSDCPIRLDHRFHGGGYAKTSAGQIALMQSLYHESGIPTDVVYTSKLMYAVRSMIVEGYFPAGSRVLTIHSGGLQGNRSLKKGILPY